MSATPRSRQVFTSALCCVIVCTIVLCNVLATEARSVGAMERSSESSRDSDSCMTRWIKLATANSVGASINPSAAEAYLASFLRLVGASSLAHLQPTMVNAAFFGNWQAVQYLLQCTGSAKSSFECVRDSPCLNGGQCVLQTAHTASGDFMCQCGAGYTGNFCATASGPCRQNDCGQGSTCKPTTDGYVCLCPPLRTGQQCQDSLLGSAVSSNSTSPINQLARRQATLRNYVVNFVNRSSTQLLNVVERLDRMESSFSEDFASLKAFIGDQKAKSGKLESSLLNVQSHVNASLQNLHAHIQKLKTTNRNNVQPSNTTTTVEPPQRPAEVPPRATGQPTRTVVHRTAVSIASVFDPKKTSSHITIENNGRRAHAHGDRGSMVGRVGYTTGIHQWQFRTAIINAWMAIGVTTLPTRPDYFRFSGTTSFSWRSDSSAHGLAGRQLGTTAKMSRWANDDVFTLTLDSDRQLLTMRLHRTGEEKTIHLARPGEPLHLYIFLYESEVVLESQSDISEV